MMQTETSSSAIAEAEQTLSCNKALKPIKSTGFLNDTICSVPIILLLLIFTFPFFKQIKPKGLAPSLQICSPAL